MYQTGCWGGVAVLCVGQIPGAHDAAEESRVGIGRAGHGGEPREVCKEGGDCGEGAESDAGGGGARGAREDGEDARRRRQQEGRRDGAWKRMCSVSSADTKGRFRPSDAMNLLNQDKRKRSHTGVTDFVS
jgi:hypothetical protein